jgi:hypothetical protein
VKPWCIKQLRWGVPTDEGADFWRDGSSKECAPLDRMEFWGNRSPKKPLSQSPTTPFYGRPALIFLHEPLRLARAQGDLCCAKRMSMVGPQTAPKSTYGLSPITPELKPDQLCHHFDFPPTPSLSAFSRWAGVRPNTSGYTVRRVRCFY